MGEVKGARPTRAPFSTGEIPDTVPPMNPTPPEDDRYVVEEVTSNYSGETWRVVRDTHADAGGLTEAEAEAKLQEVMERQERNIERMYGPRD